MSNIDKIYNISLDIKDIKNVYQTDAIFYEDDRNTSVLKINLLNNNTKIDLTDCTVTAMFLLPDEQAHTHVCTDIDVENGIVNLELPAESLKVGLCYFILSIGKDTEMAHTPLVTYRVKKGVSRDLTPADPSVPTLQQLILDVQVVKVDQEELYTQFEEKFNSVTGIQEDYKGLRRIIIEENQAADLQNQLNQTNSALETKTNKSETQNIQTQVNNLVLAGDGTQNLEVVQARGRHHTLNTRLDDSEKNSIIGQVKKVVGKNIFNMNDSFEHQEIDESGNIIENAGNYSLSNYIALEQKTIMFYKKTDSSEMNTLVYIYLFDENFTYKERIIASQLNTYANTKYSYMRVFYETWLGSYIMIEYDNITSYESYTESFLIKDNVNFETRRKEESNALYGKKIICFGDSLTEGDGVQDKTKVWGNLISKRNNMIFTNSGISGSTMGGTSETNGFYVTDRYLQINNDNYDYCLLWFGYNDFNFTELGDIYHNADTFAGAYRMTLEYFLLNKPKLKVGVIIPFLQCFQQEEPQGYSILTMQNKLIEICNKYNVPYLTIDKNTNLLPSVGSDCPSFHSDIYEAKRTVLTSDGLHLNEDGNYFASTVIENFLRSL